MDAKQRTSEQIDKEIQAAEPEAQAEGGTEVQSEAGARA